MTKESALLSLLLLTAVSAGPIHPRTRPELSDLALFAAAAFAVWLVRRALRRRFTSRD